MTFGNIKYDTSRWHNQFSIFSVDSDALTFPALRSNFWYGESEFGIIFAKYLIVFIKKKNIQKQLKTVKIFEFENSRKYVRNILIS